MLLSVQNNSTEELMKQYGTHDWIIYSNKGWPKLNIAGEVTKSKKKEVVLKKKSKVIVYMTKNLSNLSCHVRQSLMGSRTQMLKTYVMKIVFK